MDKLQKKTTMSFGDIRSCINNCKNTRNGKQWLRALMTFAVLISCFSSAFGDNDSPIILITYNNINKLSKDKLKHFLKSEERLFIPNGGNLEIELSPDYLPKGETLYYKIDDLESTWNTSRFPLIRYSFLSSGYYKLLITNDLKKENIVLTLKCGNLETNELGMFRLWWFKPLAQVCLLLVPITFFYFISLSRSRKNLKVEVVRNQIASDLHDDVGANLGAIKNLTELILRKAAKEGGSSSKVVDKIQSYTEETLSKLQDTVWAINPLNDSVEQLLEKMREFAKLIVPAKGIELQFENKCKGTVIQKLDMSQRHAMFMMYKEAVNNAVKYSNADNILIEITPTKRTIVIKVEDDGIGFDTTQKYKGNGLRNLKSRAVENHIDYELNSEKGVGTKVKMEVFGML